MNKFKFIRFKFIMAHGFSMINILMHTLIWLLINGAKVFLLSMYVIGKLDRTYILFYLQLVLFIHVVADIICQTYVYVMKFTIRAYEYNISRYLLKCRAIAQLHIFSIVSVIVIFIYAPLTIQSVALISAYSICNIYENIAFCFTLYLSPDTLNKLKVYVAESPEHYYSHELPVHSPPSYEETVIPELFVPMAPPDYSIQS